MGVFDQAISLTIIFLLGLVGLGLVGLGLELGVPRPSNGASE